MFHLAYSLWLIGSNTACVSCSYMFDYIREMLLPEKVSQLVIWRVVSVGDVDPLIFLYHL